MRQTLAALAAAAVMLGAAPSAQRGGEHWVATWATATVGRPQTPAAPAAAAPATGSPAAAGTAAAPAFLHVNDQTLRQIVRTTIAGSQLRVVFSNAFGTTPLVIGAAHAALRDKAAAIDSSSARALTFGGRPQTIVPAGAIVVSDPAPLAVPPAADLAIDLYLPGNTNTPSPLTMHAAAHQTSYVSDTGNHAGKAAFPVAATTESWFAIAHVDVLVPASTDAVVAFGDSITDGSRSTTDANGRWPDVLARRLAAKKIALGVVNGGIGGNRVLSEGTAQAGVNALARFDRDALDVPGVKCVIVLEGINDIGNARGDDGPPSAAALIAAHGQLVERGHMRGVRMIGATLTPFEGANYYTEAGETKRQALNLWIRSSHAYDAVVDLDKATRDPARPGRVLAAYDSGDHLHPNDAGYQAMGEAIDLALLTGGIGPATRAAGHAGAAK